MPAQSSPKTKSARNIKIATLVCALVVILGVSIWQLAALAPGDDTRTGFSQQLAPNGNNESSTTSGSPTEATDPDASNQTTSTATDKDTGNPAADTEASGSAAADSSSATSSSSTTPSGSNAAASGTTSPAPAPSQTTTPTTPQEPAPPATITVSFSIDCVNAVNYGNETALSLSSSGYLLSTQLTLSPGATVYDALRASGAPVSGASSALGFYVSAIYSLTEKACGPTSGWLYLVNGSQPSASSSSYTLSDGDNVQWRYSVTAGDI